MLWRGDFVRSCKQKCIRSQRIQTAGEKRCPTRAQRAMAELALKILALADRATFKQQHGGQSRSSLPKLILSNSQRV